MMMRESACELAEWDLCESGARRASRSIPSFLEFYSGRSGDNPLTDEQVKALVGLLGPDGAHGVAWSLLHVIEAAPGRGIKECLQNVENEWVARLKRSVENAQPLGFLEKRERPERGRRTARCGRHADPDFLRLKRIGCRKRADRRFKNVSR
jgi:hypothetical protein